MQYYVKEWADNKVSLIAEDGYILENFNTIAEAVVTCVKECLVWPQRVERYHTLENERSNAYGVLGISFAS